MRLVFAGTPPFAACALEALCAAGHEISLVLTQPDRPAGRGLRLAESAVAKAAMIRGLALAKPATLKQAESQALIAAAAPELMVVSAYGLLLPESVLTIPLGGCLNIHASLLPRWRGAAPIQRAILAGDSETGVAIMQMEMGLDTGPVLLERRVAILDRDTAGMLTERLAQVGAEAIVDALSRLESLHPRPQSAMGVTYATKILKPEARLDWQADAKAIDRQVRAFNPTPGAETRLGEEPLKVWAAEPTVGEGPSGMVIRHDRGCPVVACGFGALALTSIQRPGSRRMAAAEFVKARAIPIGTVLDQNRSD